MSDLRTPPEAMEAFSAKIQKVTYQADRLDALAGMEAAAPIIVAAELDRMRHLVAKLWPDPFGEFTADQAHAARVMKQQFTERLERRAAELRGEEAK